MKKPFFIMLYNPSGEHAFPLVTGDDVFGCGDVAFFETFEEADEIAQNHSYAQAFGYVIHNMEEGYEG